MVIQKYHRDNLLAAIDLHLILPELRLKSSRVEKHTAFNEASNELKLAS
jgi:hypothetical protein